MPSCLLAVPLSKCYLSFLFFFVKPRIRNNGKTYSFMSRINKPPWKRIYISRLKDSGESSKYRTKQH